jgi:hypothetical protein
MAWRGEVPAALVKPLREWVDYTLRGNPYPGSRMRGIAERVLLRLDLAAPDAEASEDDGSGEESAVRFLAYSTSAELLPDVVDAVLYLLPVPLKVAVDTSGRKPSTLATFAASRAQTAGIWAASRRVVLAGLLDDALSVLRVQSGGLGLERRADAMAEAAFVEAVRSAQAAPGAGSAASQLRDAWGCVYALGPDPVKGYALAIKAVESAAHAVVEPRNLKATLGTMLGHLKANRSRFSLVIAGPGGRGDVGPLIECMKMLWEGQTSRHGSSRPTRDETPEEATMALHLSVMLVQWFASGAVRAVTV